MFYQQPLERVKPSPSEPVRILVLVSGGGTNLQALIDAEKAGTLGVPAGPGGRPAAEGPWARVVCVVSDRSGAYALERAKAAGLPALTETPDTSVQKGDRREELSDRILVRAKEYGADLIVLAGFLSILEGRLLETYAGRVLNLHPALLPKHGGAGMYGDHVHAAVLAAGEKESGCTVHLVDAGTDTGPIVLRRKVPVLPGDTVRTLADRVHVEEHKAIVDAVAAILR